VYVRFGPIEFLFSHVSGTSRSRVVLRPNVLISVRLRAGNSPSLFQRFGEAESGADDQNRTGDLVLTKDALCQLSYIGPPALNARLAGSFGAAGSCSSPTCAASAISRVTIVTSNNFCGRESLPGRSRAYQPSGAAKSGAGDGDRTRDQ